MPFPRPVWHGLALALAAQMGLAAMASAQESDGTTTTSEAPAAAQEAPAQVAGLPEGCRNALPQGAGAMEPMQMPATMAETGFGPAMQRMHGPMMAAMQISDPDFAFACAMIPHHQGAIDMAQQVLNSGKDDELKAMAGKMVKEQQKEIDKLRDWIEAHKAG